MCQDLLSTFRDAAKVFGVPLAEEETAGPIKVITFLGIKLEPENDVMPA